MKNTVSRTFYYTTFNPNTNRFDCEQVERERPMTKRERNIYNGYIACCWGVVLHFIAIVISIIVQPTSLWGILTLSAIGVSLVVLAWLAVRLEDKCDNFDASGFDLDQLICNGENERQEQIAKEWREKHRFEEAIRQAQETQSSVSIAEAAKIYAEYIKGE